MTSSSEELSIPSEDTAVAPSIPLPENKIYFPALDGLRGFAALIVFIEHYVLGGRNTIYRWGWTGVDIFFVLSGFLITGILFDTASTPHRFRNFYIRRALRIFPLYYGVLIFVFLLTPVMHWAWNEIWALLPLYLSNYDIVLNTKLHLGTAAELQNLFSRNTGITISFSHFWSLCVEEQFYLIWPFLVFSIRDRVRLRNLCILVIVLSPLVRLIALYLLSPRLLTDGILYRATPFRIDALLIGAFVALVLRGPYAEQLHRLAWPSLGGSFVLLMSLWLLFGGVLHQGFSADSNVPWMSTIGFTIVDILAACVLLLTLREGTIFHRIFSVKYLRQLGQISYGFYIFHDIPHRLYDRLSMLLTANHLFYARLAVIPIAFGCTIGISLLSYRYFETTFLRMKGRFSA